MTTSKIACGSLTWPALALALAAGCGKDKSETDEMAEKLAAAYCDAVYACCEARDLAMDPSGPDRASCEKHNTSSFGGYLGNVARAEKKGRARINRDMVDACAAALRAASCADLKDNGADPTPACDDLTEPLVAAGGACLIDEECVGGGCQGADGDHEGVCVPFAATDGDCKAAPCGQGLYCQPGSDLCKPKKADGEACNLNLECATGGCNGKDADAGTAGTCGKKGGEASTCFLTEGCSATGVRPVAALPVALLVLAVVLGRRKRR